MKRLDCYVYTHRRRWGLTQPELAFLLGWKSGSTISLLEKRGREPKLTCVAALDLIFGTEKDDLFPKLFLAAEDEVAARMNDLYERLQGDPSRKTKEKLELLEQAMERVRARVKEREE